MSAVHATAIVHPEAKLHPSVEVGPYAVIGPKVKIGEGSKVGPHAVIEGHPRTGDLMPIMTQLGPAVPAGLTRYSSAVFGEGYRDNFFAAMFSLRKVTRNVLEPSGATFVNRESDFLVSSSRDFHPTDVVEDAENARLAD